MGAPRPILSFLWPILLRSSEPARVSASIVRKNNCAIHVRHAAARRHFVSTPICLDQPTIQRYGTAQEPAPHLRDQDVAKDGEQNSVVAEEQNAEESVPEEVEEEEAPTSTESPSTPNKTSTTETTPIPTPPPEPPKPDPKQTDSILYMPSPQEEEARKPPHLKTPPYVHHFDTYGLVRELSKSHYTPEQSITLMKVVRQMLLDNMALAREGLVSKSNVENETYLFRAACSELKTEIGNSRKAEIERMRTERNQLQHEVDILGQRLGQETTGLRDELKGLFDDRKMAVRQEQRVMENKIQELNYKITVALNSDARSEVEGLRWVLTRRAAITVGVSAFMLFVALKYSSYVAHQRQEDRKKGPPHKPSPLEELSDNSPTAPISLPGQQESLGGELLATEGVSLG